MFWLGLVMPGGQGAWPWPTGTSGWWRRGSSDNSGGPVAERDVEGMSDTTAATDMVQIYIVVKLADFPRRLYPTINPDINPSVPLTISASGPPKSRNIMRTPSSEDILRCSKGCCSRILFLTPISSVNSVKPSSMWTPRVHSFPFQLHAARMENKET